jgi:hypothetical protein
VGLRAIYVSLWVLAAVLRSLPGPGRSRLRLRQGLRASLRQGREGVGIRAVRGFEAFDRLDRLERRLTQLLGRPVHVVTARHDSSFTRRILRDAVGL